MARSDSLRRNAGHLSGLAQLDDDVQPGLAQLLGRGSASSTATRPLPAQHSVSAAPSRSRTHRRAIPRLQGLALASPASRVHLLRRVLAPDAQREVPSAFAAVPIGPIEVPPPARARTCRPGYPFMQSMQRDVRGTSRYRPAVARGHMDRHIVDPWATCKSHPKKTAGLGC